MKSRSSGLLTSTLLELQKAVEIVLWERRARTGQESSGYLNRWSEIAATGRVTFFTTQLIDNRQPFEVVHLNADAVRHRVLPGSHEILESPGMPWLDQDSNSRIADWGHAGGAQQLSGPELGEKPRI